MDDRTSRAREAKLSTGKDILVFAVGKHGVLPLAEVHDAMLVRKSQARVSNRKGLKTLYRSFIANPRHPNYSLSSSLVAK